MATATLNQRFYIYVYSLLYPAVLGSFLFGFLTWRCAGPGEWYIAILMGIYFLVQFGEGAAAGTPEPGAYHYDVPRFFQDLLEISFLVFVFASLGVFDAAAPGRWAIFDGQLWVTMAIAFVIPPIFRTFRVGPVEGKPLSRDAEVGGSLSLMSFAAAAASLAGYLWPAFQFWAAVIITTLIVIYLAFFVFVQPVGVYLDKRRHDWNPFKRRDVNEKEDAPQSGEDSGGNDESAV